MFSFSSEPVKVIEKLESLEAQDLDQHVTLDILNKLHNSLPEQFEKGNCHFK